MEVNSDEETVPNYLEHKFVTTEGQTVLGDTINIPYSIENILKTYENLPVQTKSVMNLNDIKPTHYYVRFFLSQLKNKIFLEILSLNYS